MHTLLRNKKNSWLVSLIFACVPVPIFSNTHGTFTKTEQILENMGTNLNEKKICKLVLTMELNQKSVTESYKIPKCLKLEQPTLKYNVGSERNLKK